MITEIQTSADLFTSITSLAPLPRSVPSGNLVAYEITHFAKSADDRARTGVRAWL
jgi:hypothetical protein